MDTDRPSPGIDIAIPLQLARSHRLDVFQEGARDLADSPMRTSA